MALNQSPFSTCQ